MDAIAAGIRNLISQTGIMVFMLTVTAFILGLIIIFLVTGMIIEENRNTISLFNVLGDQPKEVNRSIFLPVTKRGKMYIIYQITKNYKLRRPERNCLKYMGR